MLGGVAVLLLLFLGFVQQLLDITKAQQAFVFNRDQSATLLREALVQGCTAKELGPKRLKALTTRELLV